MSTDGPPYFVCQLGDDSYRPNPAARFEVQMLNADGQGERSVYVGDDGTVVAVIDFTTSPGPQHLPLEGHGVPAVVIRVALQRRAGSGENVNANGDIVNPGFLPPRLPKS